MIQDLVLPHFPTIAGRERWCVCPECVEEMPVGAAMTHWLREHRGVAAPTKTAEAARMAADLRADNREEGAMSATQEKGPKGKVEDYVAGALRRAKVKVGDLTDEQRARAASPPDGLRGKDLVEHVMNGRTNASAVVDEAIAGSPELTDDEARARLKHLTEKSTGQSSTEVKEVEALRSRLGEKSARSGGRKQGSQAKYSDEIRSASKRVKELKGQHGAPGAKQHKHVREVVANELRGSRSAADLTKAEIVGASGVSSLAQLTKIARGETDRASLKPLHELAAKMGDDPFCKGRNLAAILVAWAEQTG